MQACLKGGSLAPVLAASGFQGCPCARLVVAPSRLPRRRAKLLCALASSPESHATLLEVGRDQLHVSSSCMAQIFDSQPQEPGLSQLGQSPSTSRLHHWIHVVEAHHHAVHMPEFAWVDITIYRGRTAGVPGLGKIAMSKHAKHRLEKGGLKDTGHTKVDDGLKGIASCDVGVERSYLLPPRLVGRLGRTWSSPLTSQRPALARWTPSPTHVQICCSCVPPSA